jgi:hypothetical protein
VPANRHLDGSPQRFFFEGGDNEALTAGCRDLPKPGLVGACYRVHYGHIETSMDLFDRVPAVPMWLARHIHQDQVYWCCECPLKGLLRGADDASHRVSQTFQDALHVSGFG